MRSPHASCRKFPPANARTRRLFSGQVFDTNGSLLFAFETRDPHDPTSPRREASLFDSPGLLARRLFWTQGITYVMAAFGAWGHWDVLPLVPKPHRSRKQLMWKASRPTCIFEVNQDD